MISKNRLSILVLISVLLVVVFCLSQAVFAEGAKYKIRVAYMDPPDPMTTVNSTFWVLFKSTLEELTGGEVEVKLFPGGQLGDDVHMYQQVKAGEIEITGGAAGSFGSAIYPPISILEMPYIFPSNKIALDVLKLDNPFVKELVQGLKEKTGLGIIGIVPQSFRNLTNNVRPIRKPEDMKGLKFRVQQIPAHIKMIEAAGAQAVGMAFPELYTSLQTGVVDGQENPIGHVMVHSFFEVQDYLTLDKHVIIAVMGIYNVEWFDSLPKNIQVKIMEAAEIARISSTGLSQLLDVVKIDDIKATGMNVYVCSPEEIEKFREAMQPAALEWFKENVEGGSVLVEKLLSEVEKAKQRYQNLVY